MLDKNVQTHNVRLENFKTFYELSDEEAQSAIDLLDENLQRGYTEQLIALLLRDKYESSAMKIRQVKSGNKKDAKIFDYLIDFAANKKASAEASIKKVKEHLNT